MDVRPNDSVWVTSDENGGTKSLEKLHARSIPEPIERLVDRTVARMQTMYDEARTRGSAATLDQSSWTTDEVMGPNITDKETVLTLAKMSSNAYTREPGTGEWQDVNGGFNHSQGFGWEGDGLRGHIFADTDNSTIVISLKGTSPAVFDGAETTTNDKVNDNLFFGCCCGQGGQYLWHQVCDCMTSAYTCNQTCLVKALKEKNRYYGAAIELYGNVTELYPQSTVWLAGHSLGGSTSALLGLTFGIPVTTFEAPGDALAAARLGLPSPPSAHPSAPQRRKYTGATHFGHTADPIYMGSCNAATSGCTLGGYALQTECHTGRVCRYDTVEDKGWRVGIGYHKIVSVIQDVIEIYDKVATCVPDDECVDCFNWKYFESNGSSPTTSRSSSSSSTTSPSTSLTRTTTCQTPGWWGCLDESTTSTPTSTTTSSTSTSTKSSPTTSCVEYGWFGGCLETTTLTPTSTAPTTSSSTKLTDPLTTSCVEYGWFGGCLESTTLTATPTSSSTTLEDSLTTSCAQYGWFDDCIEIVTLSCAQYGWFGGCVESVTLLPTATAAAPAAAVAMVPTVTTTRPVSVASEVR
ncbi:MAG: hypothetical protein Q9164_006369 [Protoblastenia rupestris]